MLTGYTVMKQAMCNTHLMQHKRCQRTARFVKELQMYDYKILTISVSM